MNKAMQKLKKIISLAIVWVLFVMPCSAFAAEKGSLQIVLKEGGVQIALYPVASADGTLHAEFAATEIPAERMLNDKYGRKNAKVLYRHAQSEQISGIVHTTDSNVISSVFTNTFCSSSVHSEKISLEYAIDSSVSLNF